MESYLEYREKYWDNHRYDSHKEHKLPFDTLANRIKTVKDAIALAKGDIRRYGSVLESTRKYFHESINCLINLDNFPSAKYFISQYRSLVQSTD